MSSTGKKIKELRNERNLSQRKLAELCGMSYSHICRIEKGENIPTLDTVIKISKALDISPDVFAFDEQGNVSEIILEYANQLAEKQANVFMGLMSYVNEHHCSNKYELETLIAGDNYDNFKDLVEIVIDVVKSRLQTYKNRQDKESI